MKLPRIVLSSVLLAGFLPHAIIAQTGDREANVRQSAQDVSNLHPRAVPFPVNENQTLLAKAEAPNPAFPPEPFAGNSPGRLFRFPAFRESNVSTLRQAILDPDAPVPTQARPLSQYETDARATVEDENRQLGITTYFVPGDDYVYSTDKLYKIKVQPIVRRCTDDYCRNKLILNPNHIDFALRILMTPRPVKGDGRSAVGTSYTGLLSVAVDQQNFMSRLRIYDLSPDTLMLADQAPPEQMMRAIAAAQSVNMKVDFDSYSLPSKTLHVELTPKETREFASVLARYELLTASAVLDEK